VQAQEALNAVACTGPVNAITEVRVALGANATKGQVLLERAECAMNYVLDVESARLPILKTIDADWHRQFAGFLSVSVSLPQRSHFQ
jgi:hypothetical protein